MAKGRGSSGNRWACGHCHKSWSDYWEFLRHIAKCEK